MIYQVESKTISKISELTSRVLDLVNNLDDISQSDLQGCIDAIMMDAINYGENK